MRTHTQEWLKPQKGDVFVWVGQLGQIEIPWKQMQARGVFTIYYQTEPREACDLHRADGIDEVWDYSWHNIEVNRYCAVPLFAVSKTVNVGLQCIYSLWHTTTYVRTACLHAFCLCPCRFPNPPGVPGPGSPRKHAPAHPAAVHPAGLQRRRARPLLRASGGPSGGVGDADGRHHEGAAAALGPGHLDLLRELGPLEPPLGE